MQLGDPRALTRLPVVSLYLRNSVSIWGFRKSRSSLSQSVAKWQSALRGKKFNTWLDWRAQSGADTWCQTEAALPSVGIISGGLKPPPSGKILISLNILPFLNFSLVLLGILPLCDQVLLRSSLGTHWLFSQLSLALLWFAEMPGVILPTVNTKYLPSQISQRLNVNPHTSVVWTVTGTYCRTHTKWDLHAWVWQMFAFVVYTSDRR